MKWFKHISDSLDDPFIFSLMEEFKADGYLVFFGILEIYAREFRPENDWKLIEKLSFFRHKLLISRSKLKKILSKIYKWDIEINGDTVSIFIPKFKELMDESTIKKLRYSEKNSGIIPESFRKNSVQNKKKIKDKDIDKEYTTDFLAFWDVYPKSGSKKAAFKEWNKLNGKRPPIEEIIEAINRQVEWRDTANGEFRPQWKDPERWLKHEMWNFDTQKSYTQQKEHWE